MDRKRIWPYMALAALGAILIAAGTFVLIDEGEGAVSGLCYGIGAAALSLGLGTTAVRLLIHDDSDIIRRKAIEVNDERNVRLREKVGSKTNRFLVYAISAAIVILSMMGADVSIILIVSSLLAMELVLVISLTHYYSGRM